MDTSKSMSRTLFFLGKCLVNWQSVKQLVAALSNCKADYSKSALALAKKPVFHKRSKHIQVKYHFIRSCLDEGSVESSTTS